MERFVVACWICFGEEDLILLSRGGESGVPAERGARALSCLLSPALGFLSRRLFALLSHRSYQSTIAMVLGRLAPRTFGAGAAAKRETPGKKLRLLAISPPTPIFKNVSC